MLHTATRPAAVSRRATVTVLARSSISPINRGGPKRERPQQEKAVVKSSPPPASYEILEAFFYGRAFAQTLSKRLGEAVVDAVAEVSKAAAERPQRIKEFQEEIKLLVAQQMQDAQVEQRGDSASGGSGSSQGGSGSGGAGKASTGPGDVQAMVDDLRAEIAYSRAILQQIKSGGKSGAPPGPPPA